MRAISSPLIFAAPSEDTANGFTFVDKETVEFASSLTAATIPASAMDLTKELVEEMATVAFTDDDDPAEDQADDADETDYADEIDEAEGDSKYDETGGYEQENDTAIAKETTEP